MPTFTTSIGDDPIVAPNSLFDLGKQTQIKLQNQASQDALTDAQTARDNAAGIAAGDPNAIAAAGVADPARTQAAVGSLYNANNLQRQQGAYDMAGSADLAGGVLALPPEQRAAAWDAGRARLADTGHQNLPPEAMPSTAAMEAVRTLGIPALNLMNHQTDYQTPSGADPVSVPYGDNYAGAGAPASAPIYQGTPIADNGGKTEQGQHQDALAMAESGGNPKAENNGYVGLYQYGTDRLQDLGFYNPAPGDAKNAWGGSFNIPGFPQVKTVQDFKNNVSAQNAVHAVDMNKVDQVIASTPGSQNFSRTGLHFVANLAGIAGMQKFIASNGAYEPGDNPKAPGGGTHPMQWYLKGVQADTLSDDNPYTPNGQPQVQANGQQAWGGIDFSGAGSQSAAPPQQVADSSQNSQMSSGDVLNYLLTPDQSDPSAPPSSPPTPTVRGVQTASTIGTPGLAPQPATDATPTPAPTISTSPVASGGRPVGGTGAGGQQPPQIGNPNSLFAAGANAPTPPSDSRVNPLLIPTSAGSAAEGSPSAPNALLPAPNEPTAASGAPTLPAGGGSPATQVAPGVPSSAPPMRSQAGLRPAVFKGAFVPVGPPELGQIAAYDPQGHRTVMQMPGFQPKANMTNVNGNLVASDQYGHVLGVTPIANMQRTTTAPDGRGGTDIIQGGKVVGNIPSTGRDVQMTQFKGDQDTVHESAETLNNLQTSQTRLLDARNLIEGLPTGAGADARASWSNMAHTYMTPEFASAFDKATDSPNATAAQEFKKLMTQNSGGQAKETAGANTGFNITSLYMGANPNMDLQPDANREILNLQLVQNQASQDYHRGVQSFGAASAKDFVGGKTYRPLNEFNQQWQAQKNPQVYLAAAEAMNQKPFSQWSKGLQSDELARVGGIIRSIDPTTTVLGPNGQMAVATPQAPAPQQGSQAPSQAPQQLPPRITSAQQYQQLPSGTTYVAPDGQTRRKP